MKITTEVKKELERLGFKQSSIYNEDYYTKCGFGFSTHEIRNFFHLKNRIRKSVEEEFRFEWTPGLIHTYNLLCDSYPQKSDTKMVELVIPKTKPKQTPRQKLQSALENSKDNDYVDMSHIYQNQIAIMEFLLSL